VRNRLECHAFQRLEADIVVVIFLFDFIVFLQFTFLHMIEKGGKQIAHPPQLLWNFYANTLTDN
jgi:hypothetical protein